MNLPPERSVAARAVACRAVFALAALLALATCSSEPPSPVGSTSDLIGSEPGTVYQDTISVFADTVYAFDTPIASDTELEFGRSNGYTRTIVLQPGFSGVTSGEKTLVVASAFLRLQPASVTGSFPARFYRLRDRYAEGDSIGSLDTLSAILDPTTGSPTRALQTFPETYPLPPALVQGWIREDTVRTAIAVVYTDDVNDRLATFSSQNAAVDRPVLTVNYVGGTQKSYAISGDATFIRPTGTASDLIVADGYVRRVYFRAHLDELAADAAVHTARVRFHIVPGSALGDNTTVVVYVPDSTDPASKAFLTGQAVTEETFALTDETLEFPVTNAIFLTLQGTLKDNGFVVRFKFENTELRQLELNGSAAVDSLQPRVYITSSTPAEFDP
jgi:hypothetical protein